MVETLVAVVVMSIAVMGAAALQLTAIRTARQTAFQTAASHIAADIADAVRVSRAWAIRNGRADPYLEPHHDAPDTEDTAPSPTRSCYSDACDPAEFAAFEIDEWEARIRNALPGGRFQICRDTAPWDGSRGAPAWTCRDSEAELAPVVVKLVWHTSSADANRASDANHPEETGIAVIISPGA